MNILTVIMVAYIYCRISTQYSKTSHSLDSQEDQCIEYCKNLGYNVKEIIKDKISSRNMTNFEAIKNLISVMDSGDTLIISEISRFSRNVMKGIELLEEMSKKGINIHSVKENINYSDSINKYLFRLFLNQAEYESDTISFRINTSIKHLKKIGAHIGGKTKFGYEMYFNDGIKKIRRNYSEHRIISRIKKDIAHGKKPKDIACELNDSKILYRGKLWAPSSVRYIYKNNK
jgi:DNA invertase Pin-like site-specific DNA recombinase